MAEATKKVNVKDTTAKTTATSTATTAKATTTASTATAAKKATTAKKTAAKKTTAKKTTAKKTTAKKTAAKKTTAKKAAAAEKIVVQFGENMSYEPAEIVKLCKDTFKAYNKKKKIDDITVYVRADEGKAYYVVKSGKEELQGEYILNQ